MKFLKALPSLLILALVVLGAYTLYQGGYHARERERLEAATRAAKVREAAVLDSLAEERAIADSLRRLRADEQARLRAARSANEVTTRDLSRVTAAALQAAADSAVTADSLRTVIVTLSDYIRADSIADAASARAADRLLTLQEATILADSTADARVDRAIAAVRERYENQLKVEREGRPGIIRLYVLPLAGMYASYKAGQATEAARRR